MNAVMNLVDRDAAAIGDQWQRYKSLRTGARQSTREAMECYIKCGHMLAAKKATMKHGQWLPWLAANAEVLGFDDRKTASRLMASANGALTPHLDEDSALALSRKLWGNDGPHVSHNSGENEWYTPPEIIERARRAMGSIDEDPASCETANSVVKASHYCDADADGLSQPWAGNVWLNPPYAQPLISKFAAAVASKFDAGEFTQCCVLVNNATETEWFQTIARRASAICFPSSRIKFIDKNGEPSGAPLQGQAILYLGKTTRSFVDAFAGFGLMVHVDG